MVGSRIPRNWRRAVPSSLRQALEWTKDYAREKHNKSVDRIADEMGLADRFVLYKWLATGRIPALCIRPFENACGAAFVTRWIAASAGSLLVEVPIGRRLKGSDVGELHAGFAAAVQLLTAAYAGKATPEETIDALSAHLTDVAWHRANLTQLSAPELDFERPSD